MKPSFIIKKAADGEFYFILASPGGDRILSSSFYCSKIAAKRGIASVQANSRLEKHFRRFGRHDLHTSFSVTTGAGEVIALSRVYPCIDVMEADISLMKTKAAQAPVIDLAGKTNMG